jgi:hypothetical protein
LGPSGRDKNEALENVVKSQSIFLLKNVHVSEKGRTTLMGLKVVLHYVHMLELQKGKCALFGEIILLAI